MATYTLYVLGEDGLLRESLKAVSMLFDPSVGLFTSNSGIGVGSVASMGLLFSLLVILVKGIYRQELRVEELLLSLIVYIALVVPKDDVNVENLYTGTSSTVTNVPFGVAMPIALMSGLTKSLTEKMETAFSTVGGNSIAMTTEGFVSPLRLLTAIRQGAMRGGGGNGAAGVLDKNLAATINAFGHYCLKDSLGNTMSHESFMRSRDLMSWYAGTTTNGFTIQYDATNPYPGDGVALTCKNAGTYISAGLGLFSSNNLTATGVGDYIKKAFSKPITSGSEMVLVQDALKSVFSGATVDAQKAMVAFIWSDIMIQSFQEGGIASQDQRLASAAMTEAMERWRSDSAASGEGFARTMASGMSLFLFLFIALSPLVITVFMMVGWAGLKLLLSWFLFGVWTQSWLPVAAVINYYIQYSVQNVFANKMLATEQSDVWISPAYIQTVYVVLADKLAMASNMLAATPIITLTLLTGSVFSLVSLAGKTAGAGGGQFDSKTTISPSGMEATGTAQHMREGNMHRPGWSSGGGYGAGALSTSANAMAFSDSITGGQTQSVVSNVTNALSTSLSNKIATANQKAVQSAVDILSNYSHSVGVGTEKGVKNDASDTLQMIRDAATSTGTKVTKEEFNQILGKAGVNVTADKALHSSDSKNREGKAGGGDNDPLAFLDWEKRAREARNAHGAERDSLINKLADDITARFSAGLEAQSGTKGGLSADQAQQMRNGLITGISNNLTKTESGFRQIANRVSKDANFREATSDIKSLTREKANIASQTKAVSEGAGSSGLSGSSLNINRAQFTTQLEGDLRSGQFNIGQVKDSISAAVAKVKGGAAGFMDKDARALMERIEKADSMHKIMAATVDFEKSNDVKKAVLGETVKGALLGYSTEVGTRAEGDRIVDSMGQAAKLIGIEGKAVAKEAGAKTSTIEADIDKGGKKIAAQGEEITNTAGSRARNTSSSVDKATFDSIQQKLEKEHGKALGSLVKEFEGLNLEQLKELRAKGIEEVGFGNKAAEAGGGVMEMGKGALDYVIAKVSGDEAGVTAAKAKIAKGESRMKEPGSSLVNEQMKSTQEAVARHVEAIKAKAANTIADN